MLGDPRILVIVPAFNEELSLGEVIAEVRREAPHVDLLVVDDGSTDGTGNVASRLGVNTLRHPVNCGMFGAVQTGFKFALRRGYDIAIQLDADGQHAPGEIGKICKPLLPCPAEADLVIGSRFLETSGPRVHTARGLGSWIFALLTSLVCRRRITDTTCGFRACGRDLIRLYAEDDSFEFRDSIGIAFVHRLGFRVKEVPVAVRERQAGRSKINPAAALLYPLQFLIGLLMTVVRPPKDRGGNRWTSETKSSRS